MKSCAIGNGKEGNQGKPGNPGRSVETGGAPQNLYYFEGIYVNERIFPVFRECGKESGETAAVTTGSSLALAGGVTASSSKVIIKDVTL